MPKGNSTVLFSGSKVTRTMLSPGGLEEIDFGERDFVG